MKNKNKLYTSTFKSPVYETNIAIIYCKSDLERVFDYIGNDNYENHKHCDAIVIRDVTTGYIFMLLSTLKLQTILHECLHVTTKLLVPRDIHLDNHSTEEVYAYLNAYISTEVLNRVKKWGKISYIT